jgi:hypothetical protein
MQPREFRINPAAIRQRAMGGGLSTGPSQASPFGANPVSPGRHYRDDLPENYADRSWARGLEAQPEAVDEVKRAAGYLEPEGRWGTPQRVTVARTMAEAKGVAAPLTVGRECGNCSFFQGDYRSFQERVPGACRKLNVVVFGHGGCVLAQPFGEKMRRMKPGQVPTEIVEDGEQMDAPGGQIFQEDDIGLTLREEKHVRFDDEFVTQDGTTARRKMPRGLPTAGE